MKQSERNKQSRKKILDAAMEEFGTNTYEKASLNAVCSRSGISKGLMYHYFSGKDEIYLSCVKECMDAFVKSLKVGGGPGETPGEAIAGMLQERRRFFEENPYYRTVFLETAINPPNHLRAEIAELRAEFEDWSLRRLENILDQIELRDGVSREDAKEFYRIILTSFNESFRTLSGQDREFEQLAVLHEQKLPVLLDMMLYGVALQHGGKEE